jgi:DNA-binding transcriptional MerR regulator
MPYRNDQKHELNKLAGTSITIDEHDLKKTFIGGALRSILAPIGGVFSNGVGLFLSQITTIGENLTNETVQNWVKRGLLKRPKGKLYNQDQVARILMINALREILELNDIKYLLDYINGDIMDSPEVISEQELYEYFNAAIQHAKNLSLENLDNYRQMVTYIVGEYPKKKLDLQDRLIYVLTPMVMAYNAGLLKKMAMRNIEKIRENNK